MKYIKKFEKHIDDIQIGDYVVVDSNIGFKSKIGEFLKNTIGEVRSALDNTVYVEYGYSVPEYLHPYFSKSNWGTFIKTIVAKDIIFSSPDKKEVEAYLAANKYNI